MKISIFAIFLMTLVGCIEETDTVDDKLVRIFSTNSPGQKQDATIYKQIFGPEFSAELIEAHEDQQDGSTPMAPSGKALVNIFIEHVYDVPATKKAKFNWLMVNQEWVDPPKRLENIDLVLAKTEVAADLMANYAKKYNLKFKVYYTKFTSILGAERIAEKNFNLALHSAGKSHMKNTDSVLRVWMHHPDFPKLITTCRDYLPNVSGGCFSDRAKPVLKEYHIPIDKNPIVMAPNLELFTGFVPQAELEHWQKTAGYYIVPSSVEGYGHYINEGRAKGAVVITTDAPPMNEMVEDGVSGFLVPTSKSWLFNQYSDANAYGIDDAGLTRVMKKVMALSEQRKLDIGENARQAFLADRRYFRDRMKLLVDSLEEKGDLSNVPHSAYIDLTQELQKQSVKRACEGVLLKHGNTGIRLTGISETYVINLDRSQERLRSMCQEFRQADMKLTRFKAVDGKEKRLRADKLEKEGIYKPLPLVSKQIMTAGEFGIYYSHYDILKDIINKNSRVGLIFEDDARFNADLKENLKVVMSHAPADWDFIFLGCRVGERNGADPAQLTHQGSFKIIHDGRNIDATFLRLNGSVTSGAHAYLVNQKMAKHLVDHMMPIQGPVDLVWQILFIGNSENTAMFGPRNAYCVYPELAWPDKSEPSVIQEYGRGE